MVIFANGSWNSSDESFSRELVIDLFFEDSFNFVSDPDFVNLVRFSPHLKQFLEVTGLRTLHFLHFF